MISSRCNKGVGRWVLAVLSAALLLAACGGSSTTPGTQNTGASSSAVQEAQTIVDKFKVLPTFVGPGSPTNPQVLKGKNVWLVTNVNIDYNTPIIAAIKGLSTTLGFHLTVFDAKAQVPEMNRGATLAIAQGAQGIILSGIDPALIGGELQQIASKHIILVDAGGASDDAPLAAGNFGHASISFKAGGKLQSDYLIAESKGGNVNVVIFGDSEFQSEADRVTGMTDELTRVCPSCKVQVQDVQITKLTTGLQPLAQTLLVKDPTINYMMTAYDAQAQFVVPGILAVNAGSKVRLISADANAANLDFIRNHKVQIADVGQAKVEIGWALVDQLARGFNAQPQAEENIPQRIFDSSNAGTSNDDAVLYGTAFIDGYKKLWGLS